MLLHNLRAPAVTATTAAGNYKGSITASLTTLTLAPKDLTVTNGTLNTDYTYTSGVLTFIKGGTYTITGTGTATTDKIAVSSAADVNLTLDNVNIDVSATTGTCAFKIASGAGNVTVDLKGTNTLKSGENCAGLQKDTDNTKSLTIKSTTGTGSLNATGGNYGAAIGGGNSGNGSNITISGGVVIAISDTMGAGIGGGSYGNGSHITITGGTIVAVGLSGGAGIGGGYEGTCSDIKITGGSVQVAASNVGSYKGATIGNGRTSTANGTEVTPTNGTSDVQLFKLTLDGVRAETKVTALSIADNTYGTDDIYTDTSGEIYVYLPAGAAGKAVTASTATDDYKGSITASWTKLTKAVKAFSVTGGTVGTDYTYTSGVLTFTKGGTYTVTGTGTATADTIVVSTGDVNLTLDNVNIDVSSTTDACAFLIESTAGNVTVDLAGTNILKSGENCAGLQKDTDGTQSLTIKSTTGTGLLDAVGGQSGAGIGGGNGCDGSNITISGGTVTVTGGNNGAGIGGGNSRGGSDITISGGTVTATGGYLGAGIGGGYFGISSDIKIIGGSVNASSIGETPTDNATPTPANVQLYTLTLSGISTATKVTALTIADNTYGINDIYTDASGKVYVYLPAGAVSKAVTVTTAGGTYKGTMAETAILTLQTAPATKYTLTIINGVTGRTETANYAAGSVVGLDPLKVDGYTFNGWTSPDVTITDNKFTMPAKNVTITSNWTAVSTPPSNSTPTSDNTPTVTDTTVVDKINNSTPGSIITTYGTTGTSIPEAVLQAAKDKGVTVVVNYGWYYWTIDGKTVKTPMNIDLTCTKVGSPTSTDIMEFDIAYSGALPFDAVLTVNLPGYVGNGTGLYLYRIDGTKRTYMGEGKVNNTAVSFSYNHASKYVISTVKTSDLSAGAGMFENLSPLQAAKNGIPYLLICGFLTVGMVVYKKKKLKR